ncbi:MAG: TAXI family TRAP transporter solute-binding subunit [Proteobacteria bacterium]|nr:TAXI family TRAP transporter solute-binding subunit [Pseudomonadota bacterium]MBI3498291.1 TAXI family TRAP transporter solute-binding subunit [Pseudomonadota bacterium]
MAGANRASAGKRPRVRARLLLVLAALWLPALAVSAQDIRFFRIGTGPIGGANFAIGGLLAGAISNPPGSRECERGGSCGVPGLIAVAQATAGSVENVEKIGKGQLDGGLTQADIAFWAYYGAGLYTPAGAIHELRAVANLYADFVHLVVRADSPINTVADLRGKRVSLGEPGSGTLVDAQMVLRAFRIEEASLQPSYLRVGESLDRMLAGELDALFQVGGVPTADIAELAQRLPVRLVPIAGPEIDALRASQPFFTEATIPQDAYKGVSQPVATIATGALFVVSSKVDDDTVFGIAKALWHKNTRAVFDNGPPEAKRIQLGNALSTVPIPLHPGAERYYREAKLLE